MGMNPLEFWPTYKTQLPAHARLVAKLLSAPATTANVERLFSLSAGSILCVFVVCLFIDYLIITTHIIGGSCGLGWVRHRPFQVAGECLHHHYIIITS